jgi:hypothetical protein
VLAVSRDASISTVKTSISYKDRVAMLFLTGLEQNCDRNRMEDCAKRILSKIDQEVEWLRKNAPVLWETL